jgi:hypothetical protein
MCTFSISGPTLVKEISSPLISIPNVCYSCRVANTESKVKTPQLILIMTSCFEIMGGKSYAGSGIWHHFIKHWDLASMDNLDKKMLGLHIVGHANTGMTHKTCDCDF